MTSEMMDRAIDLLASGLTLKKTAENLGINVQTIAYHYHEDGDFFQRCSRAQMFAVEIKVDQLNEIAEAEPDVNRARLQCDNIKWTASKRHVQRYGDRLDVNVTQTVDVKSALNEGLSRALLPPRYQEKQIDVDVIDIKELNNQRVTDNTSVATYVSEDGSIEQIDILS